MSMFIAAAAGALVSTCIWRWACYTDDDDDEVYFSCFKPSASAVATPHAFLKIMERIPANSRVLDVGIGSGTYLDHEPVHKILREKNIIVDGIDISAPNILIAQQRIKKHNLETNFTARVQDATTLDAVGVYDAVLYMESFPCMSVALFLHIVRSTLVYLKPTGVTYLYHNLFDTSKNSSLVLHFGRFIKPKLRYFMGIDFGRLTTKEEMGDILQRAFPSADHPKKEITTDLLLAADASTINISFSGVRNHWFRTWASLAVFMQRNFGPRMEQHLITLKM